jgi:periplasmic protein TonB
MMTLMTALALASAADAPAGPTPPRAIDGGDRWLLTSDWPRAALAERRTGIAVVRLAINRSGEVDECAIVVSSGHADLDARTCEAMAVRGRFEPARDARGNRVRGEVLHRVNWALPRGR